MDRFVALGGGAGPSLAARALWDRLDNLTAVVGTSDRGSSTGTCRRLFGMPAPGDLRATLSTFISLSGGGAWAELLEERFHCEDSGDLHGMAVGNLFLAALFQRTEDLAETMRKAAEITGMRGRVWPVTAEVSDLQAELEDGTLVQGEVAVRAPGKSPIRRMDWAGRTPRASRGVLDALREADLILLGPGCLYTSLMPCLLVEGVSETLRERNGLFVFLCNTTTSPGQTDNLSVARHVEEVMRVLGTDGLDAVVIHQGDIPSQAERAYTALGVVPIQPTAEDLRRIESLGVRPFCFPLILDPPPRPRILHKVDTLRHDPRKVRMALEDVCREFGMDL